MINKNVVFKPLREIVTMDTNYITAKQVKEMVRECGSVRILTAGSFEGYTTQAVAGEHVKKGPDISIPKRGKDTMRYHKGNIVNSNNYLLYSKDDNLYFYLLSQKRAMRQKR